MTTRRTILLGSGALAFAGAGGACLAWRGLGSLGEYEAAVAAARAALRKSPEIGEFIRFATLAASGHNTQPWRFRVGTNSVDILPDFSRRTPVVDPDDHHLLASLGCAVENLGLAAGERGRGGEIDFDPSNDGAVRLTLGRAAVRDGALFGAIPQRQSSRTDYDGKTVAAEKLQKLTEAAAIPGVDLFLITDRPQIGRVRDLVIAGNGAQMAELAFIQELKRWLRFNPKQALATGDGLFSASSGSPMLPTWMGPRMFDLVFNAGAENDKYARQIASSPGIAVFVAQQADRAHWVLAGRACQLFALQATALGLKCAFINQPVEVSALRPELASLISVPGRRPDLVMRFGYGPSLPYSAWRPVGETMLLHDQQAIR